MKPVIIRRGDGEYSTVTLPNGIIETCWFGSDGSSKVVGRTMPILIPTIAEQHVAAFEKSA